jgi:DNA repair exonuclease SbcCD nuclease subunit
VSSDCHLQGYTWAKHPELRGDSYYSFQQIVDFSVGNDLSLILPGDVINVKRPDPRTVGFLMDQITRMGNANLPIYFIQGQHEMNRDRPWLNAHDLPVHIHRQSIEIGDRQFYGLDYVPADQLQLELDEIPVGTEVLIAHQVWREHMGEKMPSEGSFADIPYVQQVITGDFHAHKVTHFCGSHKQELTVVSPGSTYMLTLDEDPRKYFFVLYDDLSVESIPLRTRPYYKTRIGSNESLEKFIAAQPLVQTSKRVKDPYADLPEHIRIPIWHVEYYDNVSDVAKRLEQVAADKAHLFLRPIRAKDDAPPLEGEDRQVIEMQNTLEGYLPYCVQDSDPGYSTALRLLRCNDPKVELKQLFDETIAAEIQMETVGGWSVVQEG